jgi:hypothetical protein
MQTRIMSMSNLGSVLREQSFPSVDPRVGWALTVICLLLGLLFVFGIFRINVVHLSGWVWVQVVIAQIVTAIVVGGAAHFSSRKRATAANVEAQENAGERQPSA